VGNLKKSVPELGTHHVARALLGVLGKGGRSVGNQVRLLDGLHGRRQLQAGLLVRLVVPARSRMLGGGAGELRGWHHGGGTATWLLALLLGQLLGVLLGCLDIRGSMEKRRVI